MVRRQNVVLITGAGASVPYGFPDGAQLTQRIAEFCAEPTSTGSRIVRNVIANCPDLREFGRALTGSEEASIDSFLQREQNAEFRDAGRACIAYQMLHEEKKVRDDYRAKPKSDWMKLLINRLRDGVRKSGDLEQNRVHVVTFNFDYLLEWRWRNALRFGMRLEGAALEAACRTLEVLHVNGSLIPSCTPQGAGERGFGDPFSEVHVSACYKGLGFFHDANRSRLNKPARDTIFAADVLAFLGFSFHPMNLERLQFSTVAGIRVENERPLDIYATGYGLREHERRMAEECMRGKLTKEQCPIVFAPREEDDSMCLLCQYPVLDTGEPPPQNQ